MSYILIRMELDDVDYFELLIINAFICVCAFEEGVVQFGCAWVKNATLESVYSIYWDLTKVLFFTNGS